MQERSRDKKCVQNVIMGLVHVSNIVYKRLHSQSEVGYCFEYVAVFLVDLFGKGLAEDVSL
jgi:hypothetical protein